MTPELRDLLSYLKKTKNSSFKKIAQLADATLAEEEAALGSEESKDKLYGTLTIDVFELESLVNKDKFSMKPQDIGLIGIQK